MICNRLYILPKICIIDNENILSIIRHCHGILDLSKYKYKDLKIKFISTYAVFEKNTHGFIYFINNIGIMQK